MAKWGGGVRIKEISPVKSFCQETKCRIKSNKFKHQLSSDHLHDNEHKKSTEPIGHLIKTDLFWLELKLSFAAWPLAHQRLIVLDQTHRPCGLFIIWQLVRHRRKNRTVVPLGHRIVGWEKSLWNIGRSWFLTHSSSFILAFQRLCKDISQCETPNLVLKLFLVLPRREKQRKVFFFIRKTQIYWIWRVSKLFYAASFFELFYIEKLKCTHSPDLQVGLSQQMAEFLSILRAAL